MSSGTPIFLAPSMFTGIHAALEHVAKDVSVAGIIFLQYAFAPFYLLLHMHILYTLLYKKQLKL